MPLMEQLGNIGSEVSRASRARMSGNASRERSALERFLELIDLTIADPRLKGRRKEICRVREVILDYFVGGNQFRSTSESLDRYFMPFAIAARRKPRSGASGAVHLPGTFTSSKYEPLQSLPPPPLNTDPLSAGR